MMELLNIIEAETLAFKVVEFLMLELETVELETMLEKMTELFAMEPLMLEFSMVALNTML